ncbi:thioredoxin domain-containing protein 17 isoform X1 [Rhagoletis pomonella]|uniref:thioredoxin domain-containing protein 17 isoform X1 n=2 Tax=Rhagoletis pomonella TaxID=28610 RepID=UPI001783483D|nr:thioredoxin domain-containing protein 17 isoform X1 [Rhagoletis pomonella]
MTVPPQFNQLIAAHENKRNADHNSNLSVKLVKFIAITKYNLQNPYQIIKLITLDSKSSTREEEESPEMEIIKVSGYKAFREIVEKLTHERSNQINVYFTGEKDATGKSWCPDCNDAEPFVLSALKQHADKNSVFVVVDVGPRAFWKDMKNPFRSDSVAPISVIPTLLRWKSPARLDGEQCAKPSLLEMFFTEDVD